jgi:hypothetical protein
VGFAEARDFTGDGAAVDVHHLHPSLVGDEKLAGGGIEGEVVPIASAADDPGLLDGEGLAGELVGGRDRSCLRGEDGAGR